MCAVFGIDVSKTSSEAAILVNGEKVHGYTTVSYTHLDVYKRQQNMYQHHPYGWLY